MKPEDHWDPRRSLAVMIAIFGFVCVLLAGLGSDERLSQIMARGFVVACACAVTGYLCGIVVKILFKELPQPESTDFVRLRGELTKTLDGLPEDVAEAFYHSLDENTQEESSESEGETEPDSDSDRPDRENQQAKTNVNETETETQEKEGAMVSDST